MTKHLIMAGSAALFLFAAGCNYTRIAQQPLNPEQENWVNIIRESYPDYKQPPRTSSNFKGHTENRVSSLNNTDLKPADDPAENTGDANNEITSEELKPVEPEKTEEKTAETDTAVVEVTDSGEKPVAEKEAESTAKPAVEPPDPTSSTVYEVKGGDTLGSISQKFYGSARHSGIIFKANTDILTDANTLHPGMKLLIPQL